MELAKQRVAQGDAACIKADSKAIARTVESHDRDVCFKTMRKPKEMEAFSHRLPILRRLHACTCIFSQTQRRRLSTLPNLRHTPTLANLRKYAHHPPDFEEPGTWTYEEEEKNQPRERYKTHLLAQSFAPWQRLPRRCPALSGNIAVSPITTQASQKRRRYS